MRRLVALLAVPVLVLVLAAQAAAARDATSWAKPQIQRVVTAGVMGESLVTFQGDAPLDQRTLQSVIERLNERFLALRAPAAPPTTTTTTTPAATTNTTPAATTTTTAITTTTTTTTAAATSPWALSKWKATAPDKPVTVAEFDRVLVNALGLAGAAKRIRTELVRLGLKPPGRAGTETVARLLGLRLNHPAGQDELELLPDQPITRAEAAYSVAQALDYDLQRRQGVDALAATFALPDLTPWQQRILTTAVGYVGYPYVWGGTSPTADGQVAGGFDCSGFVWRVYKLTTYADAPALAALLRGRTTFQMSAEVPRAARIAKVEELLPGDVLFFGKGPKSKPAQVDHTGIYMGNGWMVHSSRYGTTITPFDGWYRSAFAWARRPLAEAALS